MRLNLKRWWWTAPLFLAALAGLLSVRPALAEEQVIRLTAKKFEYSVKEIRVKKGVPVIIELTSVDRIHGFSIPTLGVRDNAVPGQVARIRIVPDKAGTHVFFCDVFCGDGHEEMSGMLIVEN